MRADRILLCIFVLLSAGIPILADTVPCQLERIYPTDGYYEDMFGVSAAIEGDWVFFGAENDDPAGDDSGAVSVFRQTAPGVWVLETMLVPADGATGDGFGGALSVDGGLLVVGASGDDDLGGRSGAAYVFRFDGTQWVEEAKLTAVDGAAGDNFGCAVSVSGSRVLVGAYGKNSPGSNAGAAYVFDDQGGGTWANAARLTASNGAAADSFGISVSLDGDLALVGAILGDGLVVDSGTAYIFRRSVLGVWLEEDMLQAVDGAGWTYFGGAVSLEGDLALVGASLHLDSGVAYVFHRSGTMWPQESQLLGGGAAAGHYFGAAVDLDQGRALVGAPRDSSGAVYQFTAQGTTWSQDWMKRPAGGGGDFGWSLDMDGNLAAIGAPVGEGAYTLSGVGFIHGLDFAACGTINANLDCVPAFGTVPFDLTVDGSLHNSLVDASRRIAAHIDLELAGGLWFPNWRAGWANLGPHDVQPFTLNLTVPAVGSVIGDNTITIVAEDVTPPPWNQPPFAPSGDTASDNCRFDADWPVEGKLLAPDGQEGDLFGFSLAVEGDVLLVGATYGNGPPQDCGSVYVFNRVGADWVYQEELLAHDSDIYDRFGCAVDIDGDYAVIGAWWGEGMEYNCGTGYIFHNDGSGWSEVAELMAWDATEQGVEYGRDVAIDGNLAVFGAAYASFHGEVTGLAYLYRDNGLGWVAETRLRASDGEALDGFGKAVAVDGDLAVIGAYRDDDQALDAGAAYIFRYDGAAWGEEQKLVASDGSAYAEFGWDVAISGDRIAVSAHHEQPFGYDVGAVYIFRWSGTSWYQEAKLTAGDAVSQQKFGESLAFDGGRLLVGAPGDGGWPGSLNGAVYLFRVDGSLWEEVAKYVAYDGAVGDHYGYALAMDGLTAFCGAVYDDDNGGNSGSVYNIGH